MYLFVLLVTNPIWIYGLGVWMHSAPLEDIHQHTLPFCYIAWDWAQVVGWDAVAQTVGLYDKTMAQTVGLCSS